MLVGFPIAFIIGSIVFDLLAQLTENDAFTDSARYLIIGGIASALLAAIPGIFEFIYTLPPKSSGKDRAAKHGIMNVLIVALFGIILWLRDDVSPLVLLLLEFAGLVGLAFSGWMGGTLVYRNQIGVDVRYAEAGKWQETDLDGNQTEYDLGPEDQLKDNQMKLIRLGEERWVLGRTGGEYVVFEDRCPHKGGSLAGGALVCGQVQCPWHGSQFEITTGTLTAGPAKSGIKTYPVSVSAGRLIFKR